MAVLKYSFFKGEIRLVWMLLPVIAGILGAELVSVAVYIELKFICLVLLTLSIVLLLLYRKMHLYFKRWLPGLLIYLLLFFLSLYSAISQKDGLHEAYFRRQKGDALVVTVCSEPKKTGDIIRLQVSVEQVVKQQRMVPGKGSLLLAIKQLAAPGTYYRYGDRLLIPFKVDEIDPPFNPFEFDYKNYLAHQGLYYQSFLRDDQVKVMAQHKGNALIAYALNLRQQLVNDFNRFIPNPESAALASTLILGYKAELSQEVISAYSKTGTMHVLSVSGMHVLLVFSILQFLLGFMDGNVRLRVLKVVLILVLIWFYALLTGFSSAVCRASLMCSIYVIGVTFRLKRNAYNTLAASALLLLIVRPSFLFDAGCQLSYLAVLGLVYLHPKIFHLLDVKHKLLKEVWNAASVSMAAQVATIPLSLYYFHQFPLYFLFSNLLIALPVALLMYGGIAFLVLLQLDTYIPAKVLMGIGHGLGKLIEVLNKSLAYIENMPYASLRFFPYGQWFYMGIFVALVLMAIALQFRYKKMVWWMLLITLVLVSYSSWNQIRLKGQQQVLFYSLRKNRAVAFVLGEQAAVWTDMVPQEKNYAFSVQPSLDAFASAKVSLLSRNAISGVFYSPHLIAFRGWKMLVCDKQFAKKRFAMQPLVDAVVLSGNPKIDLNDLKQRVRFSLLFADATNSDYRLKQWMQQAEVMGLKLYVLKRNRYCSIQL